jgi:hypothetical protein
MGISGRIIWAMALAAQVGMYGSDAEGANAITVIVVNYARAPGETLSQAQGVAGEVFRNAGMKVKWITVEEADRCDECMKRLGESTFLMRIVPDVMVTAFADGHDYIGYSLIPTKGEPGYIAGAYFERVEELAKRLNCKEPLLLGYVIAHELGHLLLGAGSHARSGIMSYPVEGRHMRLASQGRLVFEQSQVKRLRRKQEPAHVRDRLPSEKAADIARLATPE